MMQARTNIVAADGMNCKGFASVCGFMGKNFYSRWCKGCFVIIEVAMNLGVGRELQVDARGTQKVEGDNCLWE